jgi:hypothetical protein
MFKNLLILSIASLLLASCASTVRRGVVAMKVDENTAHVGVGQNEVSVGDHVELYSNRCRNKKTEPQFCEKISKGHGTVTSIISADYVTVKFDSGVPFQEGDFIEKHSH